ncbi:tripartite tricarboxylate transporter substrate-binding protein [Polynucleobacter necessarius]|uniref:tripartite tricarboxylate transporter substrate-binding protein n=1 Tax=Polynucleobacter necessarius TaxID=576610 RepID=UPI000E09B68A
MVLLVRCFTGAAYIGTSSYVMMTNSEFPAKSVGEFIALAKANPDAYNYASAGNGSASHLAMAYFDSMAGIQLVHITHQRGWRCNCRALSWSRSSCDCGQCCGTAFCQ